MSSRRPVNQPSSRTNRSTPTDAARSAIAREPLEVVVEVDRLPAVEHHRLVRGMGRQAALVGVQRGREPVEAVVRGDDVHPRRRVALARGQADLPGQQQLAAPEGGAGRRVALDPQHGAAAPGDVHAEHLAVRRGEAGGAEHHQRGRPEPGPPLARLAQPQPVGERVPLRVALVLVAAGEVEHLDEVVRRRVRRPRDPRAGSRRSPRWSGCAAAAARHRAATRPR